MLVPSWITQREMRNEAMLNGLSKNVQRERTKQKGRGHE